MAAPLWKWAGLSLMAGLVVVSLVWLFMPPPATKPNSLEISVTDAFRDARTPRRAKEAPEKGGGADLLTPDPVFVEDKGLTEKEADAAQAGYILHRCQKVISVRPGEPDSGTGWLKTPGRYTLAVEFTGSTPPVRIMIGDKIDSPSRLSIFNPDIVVEIRDGKIHALRAEAHRE